MIKYRKNESKKDINSIQQMQHRYFSLLFPENNIPLSIVTQSYATLLRAHDILCNHAQTLSPPRAKSENRRVRSSNTVRPTTRSDKVVERRRERKKKKKKTRRGNGGCH